MAMPRAHESHAQRCPHGRKTVLASASMQMQHVPSLRGGGAGAPVSSSPAPVAGAGPASGLLAGCWAAALAPVLLYCHWRAPPAVVISSVRAEMVTLSTLMHTVEGPVPPLLPLLLPLPAPKRAFPKPLGGCGFLAPPPLPQSAPHAAVLNEAVRRGEAGGGAADRCPASVKELLRGAAPCASSPVVVVVVWRGVRQPHKQRPVMTQKGMPRPRLRPTAHAEHHGGRRGRH